MREIMVFQATRQPAAQRQRYIMWKYFLLTGGMLLAVMRFPAQACAHDAHQQDGTTVKSTSRRIFNLPLPDGNSLRVLVLMPDRPRGILVMFPGGTGDIGLMPDGGIRHGDNFVIRTRYLWNRQGYAVMVPDTIDHASLRGQRSSAAYARLIEQLVTLAHRLDAGPVFLLGTSQGAIAAVNGAAHAPSDSLAGVVLSEAVSVMGGSRETVFDASPQTIRVPALVIANRDDLCRVAPPAAARQIAASMTASHDVQVLMVSGGRSQSATACGSLTPHGYFGIEEQVVTEISRWLAAHAT